MKKGKTPVLDADEARELLDSIAIAKKTAREEGTNHRNRRLSGCATAR